jgi:hypothetical protein
LNFLSFKIKFEPTFFPVLWQFAFPLPLFGEAIFYEDNFIKKN